MVANDCPQAQEDLDDISSGARNAEKRRIVSEDLVGRAWVQDLFAELEAARIVPSFLLRVATGSTNQVESVGTAGSTNQVKSVGTVGHNCFA